MAVNSEKWGTGLPRIQQNREKSKANVAKGKLQTSLCQTQGKNKPNKNAHKKLTKTQTTALL